jgi:hypothetical protein
MPNTAIEAPGLFIAPLTIASAEWLISWLNAGAANSITAAAAVATGKKGMRINLLHFN